MTTPARGLGALLFASLVIRTVVLLAWSSETGVGWQQSLLVDTDSYLRLAKNLAQSGIYGFEDDAGVVLPTAFRPPLYPWLLSWFASGGTISALAVGGLNVVLGLWAVWLTWSIGFHLRLRWAWIAALAVAMDPILLRASQSAMTETLAATLALAIWRVWLLTQPAGECGSSGCETQQESQQSHLRLLVVSALLGLLLGLAVLARPTAAPWAVLCVGSMLLIGSRCWKRRSSHALVAAACVIACVLPWTLRNLSQLGKPIWATSHGGYTLLLANNPLLYDHFQQNGPSRDWDAEPYHTAWAGRGQDGSDVATLEFWDQSIAGRAVAVPSELVDDVLAYRAARATIAREPQQFVQSCFYRLGWFWAFWPSQTSLVAQLAIGAWYAVWSCAALVGLFALLADRRRSSWLPALLLVFTLSGIHSVYWSNMRMRAPLVAAVYLLAMSTGKRRGSAFEHG